jgi:short subunit dehydrogenase-like uncharacterized protein
MRDFDLILFGVTGYTGHLVAEALLEFPEPGLRWAIAGRNEEKLESVRSALAARFPEAAQLSIVVADSLNAQDMGALVQRTRVVCTTVGPYTKYGDALVAACVEHGTDYCDLAGEVSWMRKNIDAHHESAKAGQCRIVHAAGFDSIPFDLGVVALQKAALERWGEPASSVRTATGKMKGGFSGGTVASMSLLFDAIRSDRSVLRLMANPYALVPGGSGPDRNDSRAVAFWASHNVWTAPFIMAGCNTRIVRRTHALLGHPWGEDFSYVEAMGTGRGFGGWMKGQTIRLGLGALVSIMAIPFLRWMAIGTILPHPGDGPSEKERHAGMFKAHVVGERAGETIRLDVIGEGDPGYLATSRMLAQTAVALACDELSDVYGVVTPGAAVGDALLNRLPRVGVRFELRDDS